jgi:hypothetical protein
VLQGAELDHIRRLLRWYGVPTIDAQVMVRFA